ncbi:prepilin-type N-terminal cleavage/methylation domain-containing protein [Clostridium tunisiense]|uniref:prepilin-type N-terminal cleavage/methylation domain-containing protein n=1 Tax=Clostridium tunisiense TaxID=219748 RepID=UPI00031BD22F|nr:prepilin-type N-terminal cleavage/methylation domain-containing protein [Clostridium tunisiense]
MCFIKGTIKKNQGFTLIEVIISLCLITLVGLLLLSTFSVHSNTYNYLSNHIKSDIAIKEALGFIQQDILENSEEVEVKDNEIHIKKGLSASDTNHKLYFKTVRKVVFQGSVIYVYFKNQNNDFSFTPQPLLYDVETFNVEENFDVIFIKIKTKDGNTGEKVFSRS